MSAKKKGTDLETYKYQQLKVARELRYSTRIQQLISKSTSEEEVLRAMREGRLEMRD